MFYIVWIWVVWMKFRMHYIRHIVTVTSYHRGSEQLENECVNYPYNSNRSSNGILIQYSQELHIIQSHVLKEKCIQRFPLIEWNVSMVPQDRIHMTIQFPLCDVQQSSKFHLEGRKEPFNATASLLLTPLSQLSVNISFCRCWPLVRLTEGHDFSGY